MCCSTSRSSGRRARSVTKPVADDHEVDLVALAAAGLDRAPCRRARRRLVQAQPGCRRKPACWRARFSVSAGGSCPMRTIWRMKRHLSASGRSPMCVQEPDELGPAIGVHVDQRRAGESRGVTSRAPCSSAVAALSNADAPAPSTATRLPASAPKSMSARACARTGAPAARRG